MANWPSIVRATRPSSCSWPSQWENCTFPGAERRRVPACSSNLSDSRSNRRHASEKADVDPCTGTQRVRSGQASAWKASDTDWCPEPRPTLHNTPNLRNRSSEMQLDAAHCTVLMVTIQDTMRTTNTLIALQIDQHQFYRGTFGGISPRFEYPTPKLFTPVRLISPKECKILLQQKASSFCPQIPRV